MKQHWFTPEYVSDSDTMLIADYHKTLTDTHKICSSHIKQGIKTDKAKEDAIKIVWAIYHHTERVLSELGEINIMDVEQ